MSKLYADDTNSFVESDAINGLYALGNQVFLAWNDWFFASRLILNKKKKLQAVFHRKQKKVPPHSETLKLDNVIIKQEENSKFLEVLLDQYL